MFQKIHFYTTNKYKFEFARKILREYNLEVVMERKPLIEIQAKNLVENVKFKIRQANKFPCIVEDSGLFIKKLRGFPGTITKYVFEKIDFKILKKLLEENCTACFISVIGYRDEFDEKYFVGKVKGIIDISKNNIDEAFHPFGIGKSYAEMSFNELKAYSDWGKSFRKLGEYLRLRFSA